MKAHPLATLLGMGLLWMAISCLISPLPWVSLRSWIMALACFGIIWGASREADLALSRKTGWAMIMAGWLNALWALLQFFGQDPYFVTETGTKITGERVFIGAFTGNPNFLAPFFLTCLILTAFMLATSASQQIRVVHCLSAALFSVGLLITQTLATLICIPILVLILGIAIVRIGKISHLKMMATALGLVLFIGTSIYATKLWGGEFHIRVVTWLQSAQMGQWDYLLSGRSLNWLITWEMILDKPFLGHGLGILSHNSFRYQANYPDLDYFQFTKQYALMIDAHNDYLQACAETGLVGFCLLLAGLWIYGKGVWHYSCAGLGFIRRAREDPGETAASKMNQIEYKDRWLFAGAWSTIVLAGMVNALANFPLHLSHLAAILAMAVGFSARFAGLWPDAASYIKVQQLSSRVLRRLFAGGIAGLLLFGCLWLIPPYQALRIHRSIMPKLEKLADLRLARKADTPLSMSLSREVIKQAAEAVDLDPWNAEIQMLLALAYFYNQQSERACQVYERACFLRNEQVLCANWGSTLAEMGDYATGRQKLGLALLFNPFQMQARETLKKIGEYRDRTTYPPLTWKHYPDLARPTR